MDTKISQTDREKIEDGIRLKYAQLVCETGLNNTPKTKGVLVRAEKPTI